MPFLSQSASAFTGIARVADAIIMAAIAARTTNFMLERHQSRSIWTFLIIVLVEGHLVQQGIAYQPESLAFLHPTASFADSLPTELLQPKPVRQ